MNRKYKTLRDAPRSGTIPQHTEDQENGAQGRQAMACGSLALASSVPMLTPEQADLARRMRDHLPCFAGKHLVLELLAGWLAEHNFDFRYDVFMRECGVDIYGEKRNAAAA